MPKWITLEAWAERTFDPPPKSGTLRAWAGSGQLQPPASIIGRRWMVREDAEYHPLTLPVPVTPEPLSTRAKAILQQHATSAPNRQPPSSP